MNINNVGDVASKDKCQTKEYEAWLAFLKLAEGHLQRPT